jgi:uncharacterized membrane protein (UPF0127 family)
MRRSALLIALASSLLLSACADGKLSIVSPDASKTVTVDIEVADSARERERGMMGRTSLEKGHGMFFAFKEPEMLKFWMKKTLIPLEILYFDADGRFVNALTMEPCKADPCPSYSSAALAQYALEVNPGFRTENEIGVGWSLDLASVQKNTNPK